MRWAAVILGLTLPACQGDETLTAFAQDDHLFLLAEIDGLPFPARATIDISDPGTVSGTAPCNSYSASQTAPYPWFALGPIATTRRACAELELEARFLAALAAMTIAEVAGDTLILSHTDGSEMVFRSHLLE